MFSLKIFFLLALSLLVAAESSGRLTKRFGQPHQPQLPRNLHAKRLIARAPLDLTPLIDGLGSGLGNSANGAVSGVNGVVSGVNGAVNSLTGGTSSSSAQQGVIPKPQPTPLPSPTDVNNSTDSVSTTLASSSTDSVSPTVASSSANSTTSTDTSTSSNSTTIAPSTTPKSTATDTATDTDSDVHTAPPASATTSVPVTTSSSECTGLLCLSLPPILPSSTDTTSMSPTQTASASDSATSSSAATDSNTSSTPTPSTSDQSTSSSAGGILPTLPTVSLPPLLPTASDTNSSTPTTTSAGSSSSTDGGIGTTLPPTSSASSSASTASSSSSDGGIGITIPPILPTTSSANSSATAEPTGSPASGSGTSITLPTIGKTTSETGPTTTGDTTSPTPGPTDTQSGSNSTITAPPTGPTSGPTGSDNSTIITTSPPSDSQTSPNITSVGPTVTQTPIGGANSTTVLASPSDIFQNGTAAETASATTTVLPTSMATQSDAAAFSFVTAPSLVVANSTPTTLVDPTVTDPDAVPSTSLVVLPTGTAATATPSVAALPPDLPSRIFSSTSTTPDSPKVAGHTLISILFNQELNWGFVANSDQTIGQLFLYMPSLLAGALNTDINSIYTYMLQVSIPQGWKSDTSQLGTTYLVYIQSDLVDTLASEMRTPQSAFYKQGGVPGQLAMRVVPNSLVSVNAPANGSPSPGSQAADGNTPADNKKRTDAIIGVCASVGGIAALVGIWWLVRYYQRQQTMKHRRLSNLSDPNLSNGVYGTQYDERRTSYFYAEDELRGGYEVPPVQSGENVMTQRVRAAQGQISMPALQQSTLEF